MIIDVNKYVRKLAKDNYYQTIFSNSKEHNFRLFQNDYDLTLIQIRFLKYLNFYSTIFMDIALGDIEEIVLDNEIYEDSYILYKNKKDRVNMFKANKNKEKEHIGGTRWIFKRPPK